MTLPTIAIVGRPNVGKSSYLNAAIGRRVAIVEPTPGVTRDRLVVDVEVEGREIRLMDTGGIGIVDEARLDADIEFQIDMALELADVVIFLVDGREGVTPLDLAVAARLRRLDKPLVVGVNKIDHPNKAAHAFDFHALGLGEPLAVSAQEGINVQVLLAAAVAQIPEREWGPRGEKPLAIAFVGKRNVGKSTLLNELAGESRVIVSDIAGTTRDAVDVDLEYGGRTFTAIDTAGVMRKSSIASSIEFYSQARTEAAIRRADVVLFLVDAVEEISAVDKKLASLIIDEGKPCAVLVNKWDLAEGRMTTSAYHEYFQQKMPALHFAPIVFLAARDGFNVKAAIDVAFDLADQARRRVTTGELNRVLEAAFAKRKPGGKRGYKAKIFYGVQVEESPPTFVIFVNAPDLFPANYTRYLANQFRKAFDFEEVPIHVHFRRRTSLYHD